MRLMEMQNLKKEILSFYYQVLGLEVNEYDAQMTNLTPANLEKLLPVKAVLLPSSSFILEMELRKFLKQLLTQTNNDEQKRQILHSTIGILNTVQHLNLLPPQQLDSQLLFERWNQVFISTFSELNELSFFFPNYFYDEICTQKANRVLCIAPRDSKMAFLTYIAMHDNPKNPDYLMFLNSTSLKIDLERLKLLSQMNYYHQEILVGSPTQFNRESYQKVLKSKKKP